VGFRKPTFQPTHQVGVLQRCGSTLLHELQVHQVGPMLASLGEDSAANRYIVSLADAGQEREDGPPAS
jgi:hypothetical protein